MENKPTFKQVIEIFTAVGTAVALILVSLGLAQGGSNEATARGTTSSDWNVGGNLAVTGNSTLTGDLDVTGQTSFTDDLGNTVNLCDATAADCKIQYDGNAQDFYAAIDDSADDFLLGLGSAVGTTGIVYLDENQDVGLGGASAGAKLDITGNQLVDGAADEVQLTVQGNATQTSNIFVVEETGGADLFWVDNNGDAELNGTTPALTMGDAGAEDTQITFDGNAQDFYVGLDDSADDLLIGLGSAVGTTGIIHLDENQDMGVGAASAGAKLSVTGNQLIDGAADEIQLTIQGNATQTSVLQTWEQSDGTDVGTMSNAGALDIESTFNAAGLATFQAGLTSSDGDNVVADDLRVTAQVGITATDGNPITATGTYQPITAASIVTPTLAAGTAGDLLVLINTGTNVINIVDTGNQVLTAAAALGQYDSLTLWSDGTRWIEISRADN